jgi:serine/threonine protein kinase
VVCLGENRETKEEVAVKIMNKQKNTNLDITVFYEEIAVLRRLNHPNIINTYDCYETEEDYYIVSELAFGGELFDRILTENQFEETRAAEIALLVLDAIAYLHDRGIMHRDLKPENILYADDDKDSPIKLTDFGFAKQLMTSKQGLKANEQMGTRGYAAPEIFLNKDYTERADIWSLGVIVHILLSGLPPFVELDEDEKEQAQYNPFWIYVNQMKKAPDSAVKFKGAMWASISTEARHFCAKCLTVDEITRPRARELLSHPWIMASRTKMERKMNPPVHTSASVMLNKPPSTRASSASVAVTSSPCRKPMVPFTLPTEMVVEDMSPQPSPSQTLKLKKGAGGSRKRSAMNYKKYLTMTLRRGIDLKTLSEEQILIAEGKESGKKKKNKKITAAQLMPPPRSLPVMHRQTSSVTRSTTSGSLKKNWHKELAVFRQTSNGGKTMKGVNFAKLKQEFEETRRLEQMREGEEGEDM